MAALTRFDPFREMMSLHDAMNRLFEQSFVRRGYDWGNGGTRVIRLPVNVYTTDEDVVVTASVPGLNPDDVEITFEGNLLTIRGEFPAPMENVEHLLVERYWGPFSRTLELNTPVEADRIEATFQNGVLTIVLPKAESIRPKRITVTAAS